MLQHHSQPALFVFLTLPDADGPTVGDWMPYSYKDVYDVFTRVLTTYRNAIGEDVLVFLDHYLNLIGTRFMNDPKIDELCQQIYKKHRQAMDLIWARIGSNPSAGRRGSNRAKAYAALTDQPKTMRQIMNETGITHTTYSFFCRLAEKGPVSYTHLTLPTKA